MSNNKVKKILSGLLTLIACQITAIIMLIFWIGSIITDNTFHFPSFLVGVCLELTIWTIATVITRANLYHTND